MCGPLGFRNRVRHWISFSSDCSLKSDLAAERTSPMIRSLVDDVAHIRTALIHGSISFTLSGHHLHFVHHPSGPYERYVFGSDQGYNSGRCALHPLKDSNRRFIAYHTWLIATLESIAPLLQDVSASVSTSWMLLSTNLREEVERLEDLKEIEWDSQQIRGIAAASDEDIRGIDTGESSLRAQTPSANILRQIDSSNPRHGAEP